MAALCRWTRHTSLVAVLLAGLVMAVGATVDPVPATATDDSVPAVASELYGSWERVDGDSSWEFRADGTFSYTGPAGSDEGEYRVTEEDGITRILLLDPNDPSGLTTTFQYVFTITGDRLALTAAGTTIEFQRAGDADAPAVGVIERDGVIDLVPPPDGVLELSSADLPAEVAAQLVTVGQYVAVVGPPDVLVEGDPRVLLDGLPIVRVGDATAHGGSVVDGSSTVFVDGVPAAFVGGLASDPLVFGGGPPAVGGAILPGPCRAGVPDGSGEAGTTADACVPVDHPEPISRLAEPAAAGDDRIELGDDSGFAVGDTVVIGDDEQRAELRGVVDEGSLVLDEPLELAHEVGEFVVRIPDDALTAAGDSDSGVAWWIPVAIAAVAVAGAAGAVLWWRGRRSPASG